MIDIAIRPATADDLPCVEACATAAYAPYVPVIGRKPAPMVADFSAHIANGDVWVAGTGGAVLGFVVCFAKPDTYFLENIAVFPDHAGKGVGRSLLDFCETLARASQRGSVTLYTNEKMADNLSIYAHLGYIETGRAFEDGFHRVYFRKDLPRT